MIMNQEQIPTYKLLFPVQTNPTTSVNTILTDNIVDIRLITALFNSTLINWYLYKFVFCSAIRTMHFDNYYINKIPLPHIESIIKTPIINLVDKILSLKEENPYANTALLEREIDRYIYELYELSENEISVVDKNSLMDFSISA